MLPRDERRVLLMADACSGFHRRLLEGIEQYAATVAGWVFRSYANVKENHLCEALIQDWRPTGVIAVHPVVTRPLALARSLGIPVLLGQELETSGNGTDFAGSDTDDGVSPPPQVFTDDRAVASLAVDYFAGRGLRSVAHAGSIHPHLSRQADWMETAAQGRGLRFDRYVGEVRGELDTAGRFRHWIAGLPRPTGILAASDWFAWHVIGECRSAGYSVPDDLAVLGVGDDQPWCGLAPVPLSSVSLAAEKIGYRLAGTLDRLMRGESVSGPAAVAVPPAGIVTRRSTDLIAAEDPDIADALRYIHEHAHTGCTIAEVLQAVPMDRRRLERWCRQKLGRSPLDEVQRLRVTYVKRVLTETDDPAADIARKAGFASLATLCRAFARETGTTVAAYRRQFRPG